MCPVQFLCNRRESTSLLRNFIFISIAQTMIDPHPTRACRHAAHLHDFLNPSTVSLSLLFSQSELFCEIKKNIVVILNALFLSLTYCTRYTEKPTDFGGGHRPEFCPQTLSTVDRTSCVPYIWKGAAVGRFGVDTV